MKCQTCKKNYKHYHMYNAGMCIFCERKKEIVHDLREDFDYWVVKKLRKSSDQRTVDINKGKPTSKKRYMSLYRKDGKKVNCLKCGVRFESAGFHNRFCGSCAAKNAMAAKKVEEYAIL